MKKVFIILGLLILVSTPAMALSVVNSSHDMIAGGFAVPSGGAATEVCIFCHTPHGAQVSVTLAPLWNNTTVDSTDFYTSTTTTFATDVVKINATDAPLCLSCHDGDVGDPINKPNVGDITVVGAPSTMSADATLGTDLSNDHPIGMDLTAGGDPNALDSGIRTIAAIKTNFGNVTPFFGSTDDSINIMYCSSCHDVHDNTNAPFLRKNNAGSALCKACHIK